MMYHFKGNNYNNKKFNMSKSYEYAVIQVIPHWKCISLVFATTTQDDAAQAAAPLL